MESHEQNSNPCELDNGTLQRLSDLVARAHARTSATGVAIAMVQADELITCAASGPSAPEVGTRAPIDGSFSGRCASRGEMMTCEDVMKDTRVNGEACAAMGIFSMVMVPISENKHTRGVLAAFSDRPNSFSPSQLTVLNTFAEIANELLQHRDQVSSGEPPTPVASVTDPSAKCETVLHDVLSAFEKERRANQSGRTNVTPFPDPPKPEPRPFVVTSPASTPVAPAATSAPTAPVAVNDSGRASVAAESKFATERTTERFSPQSVRPLSTGATATRMAVAPEISARPEPVSRQSNPKEDSDLLSFAVDPVPMKKTGGSVTTARADRVSAAEDAALFSSLTGQQAKSGSPMKFVFGAAVVLVLAGGVFGFSRISHRAGTVSAAAPVETASSSPAPELSSQPATPAPAAPVAEESPVKELPKVVEASHRREEAKPVQEHKSTPKEAEPLFIKSAGVPVQKAQPAAEVQAPLVASLTTSRMPEMKASVVPPKADFRTASVTAPKLLNGPRPIFPPAAHAMRLENDTVVLNAKVMANGKIGDISVVRGHPVFVQAVKEAVKHWQYTPAQLNNQPTESTIEIVFKFGEGS